MDSENLFYEAATPGRPKGAIALIVSNWPVNVERRLPRAPHRYPGAIGLIRAIPLLSCLESGQHQYEGFAPVIRMVAALGLVLISLGGNAVEVYETFPEAIDPSERYVIYLHGFIVEGSDPRPTHPEFGTYEFPSIKQALFEDGGFNLIAHHRPRLADD
jgi:hypothetical protein